MNNLDSIWHDALDQASSPRRRSAGLPVPEDRAASPHRRPPASAAVVEVWELKARNAANVQRIAALTRQNEELVRELRAFRSAEQEAGPCTAFSEDVRRLLAGEFDSDETEDLIVAMHQGMETGNLNLAYELACVAVGIPGPDEIDARCLALETLATARLPNLAPLLHSLIGFCLTSGIDRLQFRAIGAANLLPPAMRAELRPAVKEVVDGAAPGSSPKRLGALFLEQSK